MQTKKYQLRSGTRNAYYQAEADFSKFERTINILLSQVGQVDDVIFELSTEKKQADPTYGRKFGKVKAKVRENGKESRPDAELI